MVTGIEQTEQTHIQCCASVHMLDARMCDDRSDSMLGYTYKCHLKQVRQSVSDVNMHVNDKNQSICTSLSKKENKRKRENAFRPTTHISISL